MPIIIQSGRFGSGVFTPASLTPELWLDASDASSVTLNGSDVSQWADKSGNTRHMAQAVGANQPAYTTAGQNSLNVITFNGSSDRLQGSTPSDWTFLHNGTVHLVAMVARHTSGALGTWFSTTDGAAVRAGESFYRSSTTVLNNIVSSGIGANTIGNTSAGSTVSTSTQIVTALIDPSNATAASRSSVYMNAGSAIANNASVAAVGSGAQTRQFTIGALNDGTTLSFYFTGYFCELVIVSGANATEPNRTTLRDYLNTKWAVY